MFSSKIHYFPYKLSLKSLITQKDIIDLMLAENDYDRFYLENSISLEHDKTLLRLCAIFANQLKLIASIDDTFHTIFDFNGNEMYVYSKNNILIIPSCAKIESINIRDSNECYVDLPVSIELRNQSINLFLTKNNFLRSTSRIIDCDLINDRIILRSFKHAIKRIGKTNKLLELKNIIEEEIYYDRTNVSILNFNHHSEIVNGYDFLKDFKDLSSTNDIDGNFYSLPNDFVESTHDLIGNLYTVNKFVEDKVHKLETNVRILLTVLVSVIFIFLIVFICINFTYICNFFLKLKDSLRNRKRQNNYNKTKNIKKIESSAILPLDKLAEQINPIVYGHRDYDEFEQGDSVIYESSTNL